MTGYEGVSIRPMEDCTGDYATMSKWLSDPAVLAYYEGRDNPYDVERVKEKFSPRVLGKSHVVACFIQYENRDIGYIQYYEIPMEHKEKIGFSASELIYGMDLFIGEIDHWNKGIGTKAVKAMLGYLKNEIGAERVVIDPQTWNERAVRCYEKCGFTKVKLLPRNEWHEGEYKDNWLMDIKF